ncbi:hypothetical protein FXO37_31026 [Capsicum annuum]|nr:hypothetical protein FXO37_31026 [Capsicum annuum]
MGKPWSMLMAMLVILTLVINSFEVKLASAKMSERACKEERRICVNACKSILYGKVPSPKCCERIRLTHIECVCGVITPKLAALIDIKYAIRVVEGCGRRVPRNYKCENPAWRPRPTPNRGLPPTESRKKWVVCVVSLFDLQNVQNFPTGPPTARRGDADRFSPKIEPES